MVMQKAKVIKQWVTQKSLLVMSLSGLALLTACGAPRDHEAASIATDTSAQSTAPTIVDGAVALITGWALSVQVPGSDIPLMVRNHAGRCIEAGPTLCRVETAQANATQAQASGRLQVLADPQWLVGFRQAVETDVKTLGGKTEAESLSMDNVSGQLRAARDAVSQSPPRTDARTNARRDLRDLEDRVTMQTMSVSYAPLPGLLSGPGGGAILRVLEQAGTLGGFGVAILLALALLAGPVLLGLAGWRAWKRRAAGDTRQPLVPQTEPLSPA